jgi:toxin ParE1/3/4
VSARRTITLTLRARDDIADILDSSAEHFGRSARLRYEALLQAALRDLADDPARPGSQARSEFTGAVRTYHLRHSRRRQRRAGMPAPTTPRHLIVYRQPAPDELLILRLLHDAMELSRHLSGEGDAEVE